jgi:hypothetical protein
MRDFVGYMSKEIVKQLLEGEMIEVKEPAALAAKVRAALTDELGVEDRLNEDVRAILTQYADEMRRTGASYQEMYKKVKNQLARDRKLVLR